MKESFSRLRQLDHHNNDSIRLYENIQADDYPAHWNRSFEVILPVENGYQVRVFETLFDIRDGEMLIIPAGSVHEIYAPEKGRRYIFMIDQRLFYSAEGLSAVQHCFYPCVHLRHDTHAQLLPRMRDFMNRAIEEYSSRRPFACAGARLWLGLMFMETGRYLMENNEDEAACNVRHRQQNMSAFLGVCSYIAEHCHEKLTLEQVAAYSGYSKFHFARMFKAYSATSFYDFLLRRRVLMCEYLLCDSTLSITEVAIRSGFGSISTFNRIFKQHKKITPTEYRHKMQNQLFSQYPPDNE